MYVCVCVNLVLIVKHFNNENQGGNSFKRFCNNLPCIIYFYSIYNIFIVKNSYFRMKNNFTKFRSIVLAASIHACMIEKN